MCAFQKKTEVVGSLSEELSTVVQYWKTNQKIEKAKKSTDDAVDVLNELSGVSL